MKQELENLAKNLLNKEILITNTFEINSVGFNLAHILRESAKVTYCVDERYKMTKEPEGFRIIENGKVVLIQGSLESQRDYIYKIIRKLNGRIDYEINIK